jgi:hypothetical protein
VTLGYLPILTCQLILVITHMCRPVSYTWRKAGSPNDARRFYTRVPKTAEHMLLHSFALRYLIIFFQLRLDHKVAPLTNALNLCLAVSQNYGSCLTERSPIPLTPARGTRLGVSCDALGRWQQTVVTTGSLFSSV